MRHITQQALIEFVRAIFMATEVRQPIAQRVAESLVESNLQGHDSHGVVRVPLYLQQIEDGTLHPNADPEPIEDSQGVTIMNAQRGFGQWSAYVTMQKTIEKAKSLGLAAGGMMNSGHVGRLGEWVTMATVEDCVGLAFCNLGGRTGIVAPFGGTKRLLGTNPLAAGIPMDGGPPIVVDFATSVVAEGKVKIAFNKGMELPPGSILDKEGKPSISPSDLYQGGVMLPAAGHKGYGLGMLCDLLAGVLTGSGAPQLAEGQMSNGVLFLVLKIESFRALSLFWGDIQEYVDAIHANPPAAGFESVMVPGEPEQRTSATRRNQGVPVDDVTWGNLAKAAEELEVEIPIA